MREKLMSTHDVAKRLDVSPQYVRKLEEMGRLQAERTEGGYRIFKSSDVDRLAQERAQAKEQKAANHA
jgi:excisionase family DNA binding protein